MEQIKKYARLVADSCLKIEMFLLVSLTLIFGALNMVEIFRRMFGMASLRWMEEFSKYMLVVTTMIGSSIAVSSDGHMIMDTLVMVLPRRITLLLKSLTNLLCALFWGFFGYHSYFWLGKLIKIGSKMATVSIPVYIIWIPFCICCFTAALRGVIQAWKKLDEFIHYRRETTAEGGDILA